MDKTKNKWDDRENFEAKSGKYTLIEMGDDEGPAEEDIMQKVIVIISIIGKSQLTNTNMLEPPSVTAVKL